ncbi:hypothetical protein [Variovorax boronicumulans]|uniref:hypothetical protein n=1 Tax=Variovorax boronicumulans TaxID=436515 RepID=UPI001C580C91
MTTDSEPQALSNATVGQSDWWVVSQVKSHRVVYFTDDADYAPPREGDWYYVSPYRGQLPKGMTLRNCWRWRFNGHDFADAGAGQKKREIDSLLHHNKEALVKLLREKIDAVRRPFGASCISGEKVREAKLAEAHMLLDANISPPDDGFLVASAAVKNCSVREMAHRVSELHAAEHRMLRQTEQLRESLKAAIEKAETHDALIELRGRLLNELAPELNALHAIRPSHTTPQQKQAALLPRELAAEQLRLRVQLREKINDLRRPCVSHYLLDDIVLKHRGRVAQSVIAAGGALPPGIDGSTLKSYAAARGMSLVAAAKDTLTEMDATAWLLLETEQMKDAMLSRIAATATFDALKQLGTAIAALQPPRKEP